MAEDDMSHYNKADWYPAMADTKELGVWRGSGRFTEEMDTKGTWSKKMQIMCRNALDQQLKTHYLRSGHLPQLVASLRALCHNSKEKHFFPIAFLRVAQVPMVRRRLKANKGDIDDGCMRSVALAVSGKKKIKLYFGIPKKKGKKYRS